MLLFVDICAVWDGYSVYCCSVPRAWDIYQLSVKSTEPGVKFICPISARRWTFMTLTEIWYSATRLDVYAVHLENQMFDALCCCKRKHTRQSRLVKTWRFACSTLFVLVLISLSLCLRQVALFSDCLAGLFNPLKCSSVRQLHLKVCNAIQF